MHGWAIAVQEHSTEGLVQIRQGLDAYQSTWAEFQRRISWTLLAESLASWASRKAASLPWTKPFPVKKSASGYYEAELYRQRGELLFQRAARATRPRTVGEQHASESWVQHALDVVVGSRRESFELRAAMSLARLWQRQGSRPAGALLEEI